MRNNILVASALAATAIMFRGRLLIESVDQNHRWQDHCHQRQTAGG